MERKIIKGKKINDIIQMKSTIVLSKFNFFMVKEVLVDYKYIIIIDKQ
jgi:hypothetical protein